MIIFIYLYIFDIYIYTYIIYLIIHIMNKLQNSSTHVKRYLIANIPDWSEFKITDQATYLGYQMGPKGGAITSWHAPVSKYYSRAQDIFKAGAPPRVGRE